VLSLLYFLYYASTGDRWLLASCVSPSVAAALTAVLSVNLSAFEPFGFHIESLVATFLKLCLLYSYCDLNSSY
jgi:hypothetical protein